MGNEGGYLNMKSEQKELIEKWLEKAKHDELASKSLIKHRPLILDTACFHCQQAVEKYLRGIFGLSQS